MTSAQRPPNHLWPSREIRYGRRERAPWLLPPQKLAPACSIACIQAPASTPLNSTAHARSQGHVPRAKLIIHATPAVQQLDSCSERIPPRDSRCPRHHGAAPAPKLRHGSNRPEVADGALKPNKPNSKGVHADGVLRSQYHPQSLRPTVTDYTST
jgi:hypothetical protein